MSFKDKVSIDLEAEALKELKEYLHTPYLFNPEMKLLKSVAIYGYNSHGKTNLIKAYNFLKNFIFSSFNPGSIKEKLDIPIFELNTSCYHRPTFFEIILTIKDTKYRYGFEVTKEKITSEWLFYSESKTKKNHLFIRNGQDFKINKGWNKEENNKIENQAVPFATESTLLISVLFSLKSVRLIPIERWLTKNIIINTSNISRLLEDASSIYSKEDYRALILKFLNTADLGFTSIFDKIEGRKESDPSFNELLLNDIYESSIKDFKLYTNHNVYNENHELVNRIEFELLKKESSGTIKYFIIACFLAYAIKNVQLIWIDELDASLDTGLFETIIRAYNSEIINPTGSQLIFTAHNTVLLDKKLRRDQLVLVNKNGYGETSLSRMHTSETPIRIDKSIEKGYREKISTKLKNKKKDQGPSLFDDLKLE